MKLLEIIHINSGDMNQSAVKQGISTALKSRNRKHLLRYDDIDVKIASDSSKTVDLILVKSNIAIGFAELTKSPAIDGWYVVQVGILERYKGNKIGYNLYLALLKHGYKLISGRTQTPDGRYVWEKLLKEPGVKTQVLNHETGKPLAVDPWKDPDAVIVANF